MSAHLKALVGIIVLTLVMAAGFLYLNKKEMAPEGPQISMIDQMKSQGVPGFKIQDLSGKEIDLLQFKGQVLILNFWASWCEPCVEEVPSLINLVSQLDGKATLLAISGDSNKGEVEPFIKSFPGLTNKNISVIWDGEKSVLKAYGVERLPETFIVGKDLKLIKKVVGAIDWDHPESVQYFKNIIEAPVK